MCTQSNEDKNLILHKHTQIQKWNMFQRTFKVSTHTQTRCFPSFLLYQTHLRRFVGNILLFRQHARRQSLHHYKYEAPWLWMRANGFSYTTKKSYEWMTHKSGHEVTRAECCDWMKVNVEVKKKKVCTSTLHKVHSSFQHRAGGGLNLYSWGGPMRKCLFRMHRLTY